MLGNKKVGILIHGYNLHSKNWQEVAWWRNPELIGRLPQGAKIIFLTEPEIVVFGTGASEKDGKIEAAYMRDYLLEHFLELAILPDFLGVDLKKLLERIRQISRLEVKSKNTYEEIQYASYLFKEAGVEIVGSVSSPDHESRCKTYAEEIYSKDKELKVFRGNFFTWSGQVPYGEEGKWPLVIESPHRLYPAFQQILNTPKETQERFLADFKHFLKP